MLDRSSRTALGTALHRAAHQLFDRPLVFEDALAVKILGDAGTTQLRLESTRGFNARAFVVVRSRFAEDRLQLAAARGVRQYALLGAGFDTFAYRNPMAELRVYELDHPATQHTKLEYLERAGISPPENVRYIATDLEREPVTTALAREKFDFEQPAQLSWLGVTIYLTPEAIFEVLGSLAKQLAPESELVFDFTGPLHELAPERRASFDAMAREATRLGEPYRSSFEIPDLTQRLRSLGYSTVEISSPADLNQRYLAGRSDGAALRGPGYLARVVV
jgi:methyltransferase (TIGR00027 family)